MNLKLNLGCGHKILAGYLNVDKYGEPDLKHDLETFPWPWESRSVEEIVLSHVLEHLGKDTQTYQKTIQELYRICAPRAKVHITVPHHRHLHFFADPTHVRPITPLGLQLLSKKLNYQWKEAGAANSTLGIYWNVDFEIKKVEYVPSADWFYLHPEKEVNMQKLIRESEIYNNLVTEIRIQLEAVK